MYEYNCTIRRIVDGDTVDVDIDLGFDTCLVNQRIRLFGIDTPESRTRDKVEKRYGKAAAAFLANYIPVGTTQILKTHKDKAGKFGRLLGEFMVYDDVSDSQMSVKDVMIREHHGVAYFGQSKEEINEKHLVNRKFLQLGEND